MNIIYKSSKFETYSYYIIFPFLIIISLFFTYKIVSYGNINIFSIIMILIFSYVLISSTESILKLKYIEVGEDNILIRNNNQIIEYKNIVYVYNLINIKGNSLVLWYLDVNTNKLKVILMRPEKENPTNISYTNTLLGAGELQVTKFIKDKAIKSNQNYLNINNPRWFLFSISPTFKLF